ncbi:MAG: YlxM family DNA-binding protein [Clostridium sp.]|uniref:YlxM family DNA-binding protein n=1 Tax=Clostridium sp. TaxID=1506 RepID=UPI002FCA08E8
MVDSFNEVILLLDFYGGLLTDKQRLIMSYHYEEDMSLSEISEELGVSRQAVHDVIKRSEKVLKGYEKELGLVERFNYQKSKMVEIETLLKDNNDENSFKALGILNELINM